MRWIVTIALSLLVSACGGSDRRDFSSPALQKQLTDDYLAYLKSEKPLQLVSDQATIGRAADTFAKVCIDNIKDPSAAIETAESLGIDRLPSKPRDIPSINYYYSSLEQYEKLSHPSEKTYKRLAMALMREDGSIPNISGWINLPKKNLENIFGDGTILVEVSAGQNSISCSVGLRTPDDTPVLDELKRVVQEYGIAKGEPKDTGFFGKGYQPYPDLKLFLTVARERRSLEAPTYIHAIGQLPGT